MCVWGGGGGGGEDGACAALQMPLFQSEEFQ